MRERNWYGLIGMLLFGRPGNCGVDRQTASGGGIGFNILFALRWYGMIMMYALEQEAQILTYN
jgi:hypothetical protein